LFDGISGSEAEIIADSYCRKNVSCGWWTGIEDGGERWIVDARIGSGGESVNSFLFIDKRSGKVTPRVGRSYDDPRKIL
jgi:hypothetical protein